MPVSKLITRNDIQNILAHINLGDDAHTEITQADFNTLTDEEKNDGTIYFVTDGINGNVFLDDNTPVGTIAPYGGSTDPAYWLICDGRAVSRTTYAELFAIIGTAYGGGDGETTFNIPDLRGNVAVGASIDYELGDSGGEAEHVLQTSEMPAHTHGSKTLTGGFQAYRWGNGSTSGIMTVTANTLNMDTIGSGTKIAHTSYTVNATHEHTSVGEDTAHNNMQPYVVTNYIIKYASTVSEHQANIDFYYPVGSYYKTSNANFNPNTTWSGTWVSENITDDYIVEEGTSNIWTYRKWSSGVSECWGTFTSSSIVVNTAWGSDYEKLAGNVTYPSELFTTKPTLTTSLDHRGLSGWIEMGTGASATRTPDLYIVRPSSTSTAQTYGIAMYAIGTWKTYTAPNTQYIWHRTV